MNLSRLDVLGRWVAFCEHNAVAVLWTLGLLCIVSAVAAWNYASIDSDLDHLIRPSDELRWFHDSETYRAAFPQKEQTAIVVVSGASSSMVDEAATALAEQFVSDELFEYVFAPTLTPRFRQYLPYFLEVADLERWIEGVRYDYGVMLRLSDSAGIANAAFTYADQVTANSGLPLQHPLASLARSFDGASPVDIRLEGYPHLQVDSDEGYYTLIILKGQENLDQNLPNARLVERIRQLIDNTPVDSSVRVRMTGEAVLAHEEIGAALNGIGIAGALSLVLLAIILGVGIRSLRIIAGVFSLLLVGTILTLGYATLAVGSFNTLALIFVVMFFGLGVDFAVHFTLRVREAQSQPSLSVSPAVAATRDVGSALVLCMLTSMIAFLSFVPTAYRGLGELGLISAGGMFIAFALALTLIPALFAVTGGPSIPATSSRSGWSIVVFEPKKVLLVTGLLACVAVWVVKDMRFDYSVLAMRDETTEAMSTLFELQEQGYSTDYSIMVLADGAQQAAELKQAIETLPEVGAVTQPDDWIPFDQVQKRQLLAELAGLLDNISAVMPAEMDELLPEAIDNLQSVREHVRMDQLASYEALVKHLDTLLDDPAELARLNSQLQLELEQELGDLKAMADTLPFGLNDLPEDVKSQMIAPDGRYELSVQPAEPLTDRDSMEIFIRAVQEIAPNVAGRSVVEWGVGDLVVKSFLQATALALGCIFALLLLYFRSVLLPLLVLTPLALAVLFTFAIAQAVGLSLNMANILVVPLIFGLGVDTGVHVVHRFILSGNVQQAFASSTSRAVMISGLTTIGAFISLSFSPHKGAASIGMLLAIAISLILIATFVVLPALLNLCGARKQESLS